MENILRRSKDAILGNLRGRRSKTTVDGRCKKHPKHQQSPGVCSLCLSEKLSQINHMNPTSSSRRTSTTTGFGSASSTTSSLSSYYSSEDDDDDDDEDSQCSSPMQNCSTTKNNNYVLKKSRSLAFVSRNKEVRSSNVATTHDHHDDEKRGFWSKLIQYPKVINYNKKPSMSSSHRDHQAQAPKFMHSRTVGERSSLHQMVY
ncbi:suppressor protein SRP40-like [Cannabis sativa]|uniref:Uncharacterized protein n=1 Tax=Cannabis sativa TaxID=3483 RepID=A0A803QW23_CANSA|nr:suppressor protein SRP40-like [Cannabis sativa]